MHPPSPAPHVNLYLVGFMGTGKTTVARALAVRLGMQMLDSDSEIERRAGLAIPEIFAQRGEPAFRELEREFITAGHADSGCIVSCGGGLVTQPGMIEELRRRGVIICLTARPETILARTQSSRNRPLLETDDPIGRIRELLAKREPAYRAAGTQVLTDMRPLAEVVAHVQRVYLREAREFRPPMPA